MWIIQEVVLANKGFIICAWTAISWQAFQGLVSDADALFKQHEGRGISRISDLLCTSAVDLVRIRDEWNGTRQPLIPLLWKFHHHVVSRSRGWTIFRWRSSNSSQLVEYLFHCKALCIRTIHCKKNGVDEGYTFTTTVSTSESRQDSTADLQVWQYSSCCLVDCSKTFLDECD
jgi:hypothetical protein